MLGSYQRSKVLTILLLLVCLTSLPSAAQSVNARNLLKMARSSASQDDWKQAKSYAEEALKTEPGYLDALYMRAFAHRELGEYEKAEADFREVIRRDAKYLPTYGALAEMFVKQKKYDKADELFLELGKQPNGAKWSNYYRGVIAYLKHDLPTAERHWKDVLNGDTNFAPAHHNLGALYLAQGKDARALGKFREALSQKPEKAVYRLHVAWALERTGQIPAAQAMLKKVLDENVDDTKNWLLAKGLDRLTRGQPEVALESFKSVAESDPENLDVWVLLGRTHLKLNQPDEAREALEKAKELDPSFKEVEEMLSGLPEVESSQPQPSRTPLPENETETVE